MADPTLDHDVIVGRATARYVRMSPMKTRRVVDLVRGMPATDAQAIVKFDAHAASEPVGKVLASAIANAEHLAHVRNQRLDPDDLVVTEAYVDEGPTLKRFRPRAQGRAFRIRKRSSHITIVVVPTPSGRAVPTHSGRAVPTHSGRGAATRTDKPVAQRAKRSSTGRGAR